MRKIDIAMGLVALFCTLTLNSGRAQTLSNAEIRLEVASLKQELAALPASPAPRRVVNGIRDQVGSIVTASFGSYMTFLRRSFNPRRNVFDDQNNIFDFARGTLGYRPRGNALLGALFRPDFAAGLSRSEAAQTRRFVRRRLLEVGANEHRIHFVLGKIYNLRNPNDGPLPGPPQSPN
ncbi:hypothetical protein [Acuticoccus sediminis]|uniref:hypothetical protein n=1 Tax=Acuticoccus sediminis TaxID=2184697 RepID=UPI0011B940C7|nr:hypothetical protein [Acuticoccus sediminis]